MGLHSIAVSRLKNLFRQGDEGEERTARSGCGGFSFVGMVATACTAHSAVHASGVSRTIALLLTPFGCYGKGLFAGAAPWGVQGALGLLPGVWGRRPRRTLLPAMSTNKFAGGSLSLFRRTYRSRP